MATIDALDWRIAKSIVSDWFRWLVFPTISRLTLIKEKWSFPRAPSIMAASDIVQFYLSMPSVTRAYTTACVLTTLAVVSVVVVVFFFFDWWTNLPPFDSNWILPPPFSCISIQIWYSTSSRYVCLVGWSWSALTWFFVVFSYGDLWQHFCFLVPLALTSCSTLSSSIVIVRCSRRVRSADDRATFSTCFSSVVSSCV